MGEYRQIIFPLSPKNVQGSTECRWKNGLVVVKNALLMSAFSIEMVCKTKCKTTI